MVPWSTKLQGEKGERVWLPLGQPCQLEQRAAGGAAWLCSPLVPTRGCPTRRQKASRVLGPESAWMVAGCSSQQAAKPTT